MRDPYRTTPGRLRYVLAAALLALGGCAGQGVWQSARVRLTGEAENPPVRTPATGSARITVQPDHSVSGELTTYGLDVTAAHIHEGMQGESGPMIVSFSRVSGSTWVIPEGAMLTESQYASYRAGRLYVNVYSAGHPGGEIRGQIVPQQPAAKPSMYYGY